MEAALPIILKWLAAGLPEMINALQKAAPASPPVVLTPLTVPLNPQGWPSPLPPEVSDGDTAPTPSPATTKGGNPGIRLLQVALVAAGQKINVDGLSRPGGETETALAAVIQHIMSRVG